MLVVVFLLIPRPSRRRGPFPGIFAWSGDGRGLLWGGWAVPECFSTVMHPRTPCFARRAERVMPIMDEPTISTGVCSTGMVFISAISRDSIEVMVRGWSTRSLKLDLRIAAFDVTIYIFCYLIFCIETRGTHVGMRRKAEAGGWGCSGLIESQSHEVRRSSFV